MPTEQRKTVTVLFCDLTGSTSLGESIDPERLRALLARYFEQMKSIVERHGGTVEKFIGDAVMAVFGVPVLHEDDALRAVRAAVEMRDAFPELGVHGRIGVMTGEVVTGTEERLATGDAVNVAARLEQAAEPGTALIGDPTLALVRHAVDVEPVEPLALKGKAEPVPAYRLVDVHEMPERRGEERFVGRERELTLIRDAFARVQTERSCELVTIVGDAGVGKSRLVAEALAHVESLAYGRCLPYGEGITYWPAVEVLKRLGTMPRDASAAVAIRSLLGETRDEASAEEIAWAFRKTLEHAAETRPLVVVFDDIQWAEQTFLDLIEHVALLSSGASILLVCVARPELAERQPAWPVALRLEPLGDDDVEELIARRVSDDVRAKLTRAAAGNPLFVEEMLAVVQEAANGDVVVPATLRALLAARLDQLERGERSVLERAAVEGEIFHRGAVQALAPEEPQVTPQLAALARKRLIRPERPQLAGEDGFRFHHLLLRDAAYDALPKAARADFHERYARWLDRQDPSLVERDEVVAYHLEQACRYRAELGIDVDGDLATEARRRLLAGGRRANQRQDYGAAVSLLERAAALLPLTEIDLVLERELVDALFWNGRGGDAVQRAQELADRGGKAGDQVAELCGRILAAVFGGPSNKRGEGMRTLVDEALPVFRAAGHDMALYIAYDALAEFVPLDEALESYEKASAHAQRAGYAPSMRLATGAALRFFGNTPVSELLAWLDANEPRTGRDEFMRAYRAGSLAMLGRFDEARTILSEMRAELADRGTEVLLANVTAFESVWVELWADEPAAALDFAKDGWRIYQELGEETFLPAAAGERGRILYLLGRLDEAEEWIDRSAELCADRPDDERLWQQVKGKLVARRGASAEAERLARRAIAVSERYGIDVQGDAHADAAETFLLCGKRDEALAALARALECHKRKGNVVSAERVRKRLTELGAAAARG